MARRRYRRFALLLLVVAGFSGLAFQVYRSVETGTSPDIGEAALEGMLPEAVQWIRDFRRIEIREGKRTWEIEGDEAQVLAESEQVVVRGPRAFLYSEDGGRVAVRGDEGRLSFDGRDLRKVNLRDNVEVHVRDFVVRAEEAVYDHESGRIVADGPITISGERLTIEGRDMIVYVNEERAVLERDVRAKVLGSSGRPS